MRIVLSVAFYFLLIWCLRAETFHVGNGYAYATIQSALDLCRDRDSIIVHGGIYQEGNLEVTKSIALIGKDCHFSSNEFHFQFAAPLWQKL